MKKRSNEIRSNEIRSNEIRIRQELPVYLHKTHNFIFQPNHFQYLSKADKKGLLDLGFRLQEIVINQGIHAISFRKTLCLIVLSGTCITNCIIFFLGMMVSPLLSQEPQQLLSQAVTIKSTKLKQVR